jgi:myo-inositol-1(or 4)-monophosphatase
MEPRELAEICKAAAQAGARILRERADAPRQVEYKGRIDLVTDADRASEEAVLKLLRERAPGVALLAEESGAHAGGADLRFIVDPLDGTTNYAHGIPLYTCTVAAESRGQVLAGCTVDPSRGETYTAWLGGGAWLGDRKLSVSAPESLERALLCTGFPYDRREQLVDLLEYWNRFTSQAQGTRRLGSAALDLAYVAAGRLDGFWEKGLKPWDVAAGDLLVTEAGGRVTRFDGSPHRLDGAELVAASREILTAMLAVLNAPTSRPLR